MQKFIKYIIGFFANIFNPAVSLLAKIDYKSKISRKAKVLGHVQINNSTMGDYSYVGRNSRIVHADIGKFCSIGGESKIGMGTHTLDLLSTSPIFTEKRNGTRHSWVNVSAIHPFSRVSIGNDVWIGQCVMVMGGVTIGDGAVIGAGAIVTKDVPPYAIVAGVPAKIIRYRFSDEVITRLCDIKWWNLPEKEIRNSIGLFQQAPVDMPLIEVLDQCCR